MARMKTLHIAMTDPVNMYHENEELDYVRCQAWHDAINGLYVPENYSGDRRLAYDVGRLQIEETCHEEGIDLFSAFNANPTDDDTLSDTVEVELPGDRITTDGLPSDEEWASYFKDIETIR